MNSKNHQEQKQQKGNTHAPYNFVPLNNEIVQPEWASQVSHDIPFKDGLCGILQITIKNETPLLVGAGESESEKEQKNGVKPYQLPDGTYAIPGSSIKGMIRNVLQIISFGKMQEVEDRALSVRDLFNRQIYGKHFTQRNSRNYNESTSFGGWLGWNNESKNWTITPCKVARIEYRDALDFIVESDRKRKKEADNFFLNRNRDKSPLTKKYKLVLGLPLIQFKEDPYEYISKQGNREIKLSLVKAVRSTHGNKKGQLVVTGHAGRKHRDFIFYDEDLEKTLPLQGKYESVIKAFLQIHESGKAAEPWNYWYGLLKNKQIDRIPVFWISNGQNLNTKNPDIKQIRAIGLSQLFRLPYTKTIGAALETSSKDHSNTTVLDLADTLFGSLGNDGAGALKGRVSIDCARCISDIKDNSLNQSFTAILSSPKPSFYPNYIVQNSDENTGYKTLMDKKPILRGFKRYPVKPFSEKYIVIPENVETTSDVISQLSPLPEGLEFKSKIRFHNLKPIELGAILWVLTWGGQENLKHSLGMGKPFGMGQIGIKVEETKSDTINIRPNQKGQKVLSKEDYIKAFEDWMNEHEFLNGHWLQTEQLQQIIAMADPEIANDHHLEYMALNDFRNAKSGRKILYPYEDLRNKENQEN